MRAAGAAPSPEEIETLRRLILANEEVLGALSDQDRRIQDAITTARRSRAALDATFPAQFRGLARQATRARRLEAELSALRRRLGEAIGRDVLSQISATERPDTASRIRQLEQALFDAQEVLARRTEELEAARQINRELMAPAQPRELTTGRAHLCTTAKP